MNRVSWTSGIASLDFGPDRHAIAYGAPPRGLWHATRLNELGDWILADLRRREIPVDALHLHKLTVEGLVGVRIARALQRPFIVTVLGDTDLKIANVRRDLSPQWKAILQEASATIFFAPWTQDRIDGMFGLDRSKSVLLPPMVQHETFSPSPVVAEPRFVTLFHLDSHRRKNLEHLVKSIIRLSQRHPAIRLDVYGRGSPVTLLEVDKMLSAARAKACVALKGPLANDVFSATLSQYAAFLMPTRRETFGMTFIEAMFSGLPVLHSKGWGIDGYFAPDDIGYACDARDEADIERGIERLITDQARLKDRIAALYKEGQFEQFTKRSLLDRYRAMLDRVMCQ